MFLKVHQGQFITKKDKSKPPPADNLVDFPLPTQLDLSPSDYPLLAEKGLRPTILNRLTITMANNDFMIAYNKSSVAKQYDLLAINCEGSRGSSSSQASLTALLKSSFRFDLLCFNPDQVAQRNSRNEKYFSGRWSEVFAGRGSCIMSVLTGTYILSFAMHQ